MIRFKSIFRKIEIPQLNQEELNRLLLLGVKVSIARRVLEVGAQCRNYDGVLSFDAVDLMKPMNFCCDAVAVALPADRRRAFDTIGDSYCSYGVFVHVGLRGNHFMAWCDISNISMDDMFMVFEAVKLAISIDEYAKKRRALR